MRKPVAMTSTSPDASVPIGSDTVVCDDGSVWVRAWRANEEWEEINPIPGTQRDMARKEARDDG